MVPDQELVWEQALEEKLVSWALFLVGILIEAVGVLRIGLLWNKTTISSFASLILFVSKGVVNDIHTAHL
jgi:hypothetical protein